MIRLRSYFIISMCLLFLIQYFVASKWLPYLLSVLAVAAFVSSLALAKRTPQLFSLLMFAAAVALTVYKGGGLQTAVDGVTSNLPLLTLIVLVPLLSIPFKMGGFFEAILAYLQQLQNNPRKLFAGVTSVLFFLGPILNVGSIRIVHELLKDLRLSAAFMAKAYLVGFSTTILWSPYYAAVGVTLLYLNVSIGSYMAYGIGIALLFLAIGNAMFALWSKKHVSFEGEAPLQDVIAPKHRSRMQALPYILLSLMLATIAAEALTNWSMLVLVSLLAIAFPFVWILFHSMQWSIMKQHLKDYRDRSVPFINNEIIMYISAGFFGHSLRGTTFGDSIQAFMVNIAQTSFLLFALFILAVMICVTFIGIHQLVIVTVLAAQMDPVMLGTSKEIVAMVIMLAWSVSSILSPVNPINLLVSGLLGRSSIEVGLRHNGKYLFVVSLVGVILLTLVH